MADPPSNVRNVKQVMGELLDTSDTITNRDVVEALGGAITRQAVHAHLAGLVADGILAPVGAGRGARYVRRFDWVRRFVTAGLGEDAVWRELRDGVGGVAALVGDHAFHLQYLVTEMVNNAIDHSGSPEVEVRCRVDGPVVHVEVLDDGVGVFANVARATGAPGPIEAATELTVGKVTTMPERHTGEGIFFSSRSARCFRIDANSTRLTFDNERADWALGQSTRSIGSSIVFDLDTSVPSRLTELFEHHADDDFRFNTTSTAIKLFEFGTTFVSRSEAKRLAARLEPFDRVELDFAAVESVGQGFVDELFRVWASQHPSTELVVRGANPAVRFMIDRASA